MRSAGLRARAVDFFIEPRPPDDPTAPSVPERDSRAYLAPAAPAAPSVRSAPAPARARMPGQPAVAPVIRPAPAPARTRMPGQPAVAPVIRPAPAPARARTATRMPFRAAVLGAAAEAVPVGALLASALRSAAGASAAGLAVWMPGQSRAVRSGPATFAASRLAARLSARGLPAVARGRLAWMRLDDHPVAATVAARRAGGALEVPLVVVLAGPRCEVVEGLLGEQDLVVVAAAEPDGPLARLAVASCAAAAVACAPPGAGPLRWLACSGLVTRGLAPPVRSLARDLAVQLADELTEVAW